MEPTIAPATAPIFEVSLAFWPDALLFDGSVSVGCDMVVVVDECPDVGVMLATAATPSVKPSYGYANAWSAVPVAVNIVVACAAELS